MSINNLNNYQDKLNNAINNNDKSTVKDILKTAQKTLSSEQFVALINGEGQKADQIPLLILSKKINTLSEHDQEDAIKITDLFLDHYKINPNRKVEGKPLIALLAEEAAKVVKNRRYPNFAILIHFLLSNENIDIDSKLETSQTINEYLEAQYKEKSLPKTLMAVEALIAELGKGIFIENDKKAELSDIKAAAEKACSHQANVEDFRHLIKVINQAKYGSDNESYYKKIQLPVYKELSLTEYLSLMTSSKKEMDKYDQEGLKAVTEILLENGFEFPDTSVFRKRGFGDFTES